MVKDETVTVDMKGPKSNSYVDFNNVKMAIYHGENGALYVNLEDTSETTKSMTFNAETLYKVVDIMNRVFEQRSNAPVKHTLN